METLRRSRAGRRLWEKHIANLKSTLISIIVIVFLMPLLCFVFMDELASPWTGVLLMVCVLTAGYGAIKCWERWWEKNHANNERGARGERAVGRELEKLHIEGFHIFHDYKPENYGNVDHFLIGDAGVFVVETKAWSGEITTDGKNILVNGRCYPKNDPIRQTKSEATRVRHLMQMSGKLDVKVRPILCFTGDNLRVYGPVRGVEVTSLGALNRTVMQLAARVPDEECLSQSMVRVLSGRLSKHLEVRPAASPGQPPESPGILSRLRQRADTVFIVVYLCYVFILTLVFADETATILDSVTELYRMLGLLVNYYL